MMDGRERISVNPKVCHGQPCVKGTRITVSVVLDGWRRQRDEILASYPGLTDAIWMPRSPMQQNSPAKAPSLCHSKLARDF